MRIHSGPVRDPQKGGGKAKYLFTTWFQLGSAEGKGGQIRVLSRGSGGKEGKGGTCYVGNKQGYGRVINWINIIYPIAGTTQALPERPSFANPPPLLLCSLPSLIQVTGKFNFWRTYQNSVYCSNNSVFREIHRNSSRSHEISVDLATLLLAAQRLASLQPVWGECWERGRAGLLTGDAICGRLSWG